MKTKQFNARRYEAALRASMATPAAQQFADNWNTQWSEFSSNLEQSRSQGFINTRNAQFEPMRFRKNETRLDTDVPHQQKVLPNKGIDLDIAVLVNSEIALQVKLYGTYEARVVADDRAPNWRSVVRDRKIEHTAITHFPMRYQNLLKRLEFTTDLVLTPAQMTWLAGQHALGGQCKVYCSVRRRDTNATALLLRDDDVYVLLFEDGSFAKNHRIPNFAHPKATDRNLTWPYNKRVKRNVTNAPVNQVRADVSATCFSINRGYAAR